jgi:mono/diheme cytochrome c family protein
VRQRRREIFAIGCFLAALTAGASESPRYNFLLHCGGCHQSDGSGAPDSGVPSFLGNLGYFLRNPAGRRFLAQVPGSSQSPLDDQDLADVLNWILTDFCRAELPATFSPFTADEVHAARGTPLADVKAQRARIITELHADGYPVR